MTKDEAMTEILNVMMFLVIFGGLVAFTLIAFSCFYGIVKHSLIKQNKSNPLAIQKEVVSIVSKKSKSHRSIYDDSQVPW